MAKPDVFGFLSFSIAAFDADYAKRPGNGPHFACETFPKPGSLQFERIYACCPKNGTFLVFGTPTPRSMDDVERTAMTDHPIWPLIRRSCAAHAQGSGRMHRIAAKRHLFETGRVQLRRKRNCSSQGACSYEEVKRLRNRGAQLRRKKDLFETRCVQLKRSETCSQQEAASCEEKGLVPNRTRAVMKKRTSFETGLVQL